MSNVIGIDLGTTNTRVVAQRNSLPHVVINETGGFETPSAIVVDQTDGFLVGGVIKSRFISHPAETITPFRQLLGRRFDELRTDNLHYTVVSDDEGLPLIEVGDRRYRPVALCAALLSRLAKDAVIRSDSAARSVVLTIPPGSDTRYRTALRHAVADAGLSLKVFIENPIAAVLGCGLDDASGSLIAVYDFGGESFSISIVSLDRTGPKIRATETLPGVGSACIDRSLARWLMAAFHKKRGIDLAQNPQAYRRLVLEAERIRIMLSSLYETPLLLPYAINGNKKAHLATRIKRVQLERFTDSVLRQTLLPCQRVFAAARIKISDLSEVLVVGAPARMPRLHEFMRTIFGRKIQITIAPPEAQAEGAWLSGAFMTGAIDPTKPRPRKGFCLTADPTREINRMVGRLREGPDPTAVPSPGIKSPTRAEPASADAAPSTGDFAFQLEGDENGYAEFSIIEITEDELKAETNAAVTASSPTTTEETPAAAAPTTADPPEPITTPDEQTPDEEPLFATAPASRPAASRSSQTMLWLAAVVLVVGLGLLVNPLVKLLTDH